MREPGRWRYRLAAACVLVVVFAGAGRDGRGEAAPAPERIHLVLGADPTVGARVLAVLKASFDRRGLELDGDITPRIDPREIAQARPKPSAADPVVRVWLDLVAAHPVLYLVSVPTGAVYIRPLSVSKDPDGVELEVIRFVVDSAVNALREGRLEGVSREEFEKSLPPSSLRAPTSAPPELPAQIPSPVRPPAASSSNASADTPDAPADSSFTSGWSLVGAYSVSLLSSSVFAHGAELGAEVDLVKVRATCRLLQRWPVAVTRDSVRTTLTTAGVHCWASASVFARPHFALFVGAGAGLAAIRVSPTGDGAVAPFWIPDPTAMALVSFQGRLSRRLLASAELGMDIDLQRPEYKVVRSGGTTTLWRPLRWRPFVSLALSFAF